MPMRYGAKRSTAAVWISIAVHVVLIGLVAGGVRLAAMRRRPRIHDVELIQTPEKPRPRPRPRPRFRPPPRPRPRPRRRVHRPPPPVQQQPQPREVVDLTDLPALGTPVTAVGASAFTVPVGSPQGRADGTGQGAPPPPPPRPRPRPVTVKVLPKPIHVPRLPYPEAARRQGIEGTVKLEVLVGRDGRVKKIRVLESVGFGLDEVAVRALRQARFAPAKGSDGRPMPYTIRYRYTFRLER